MAVEVNFYHLTRDKLEVALPKLAKLALAQGLRTVIRAPDDARVQMLDELLWTFEIDSFLPHGTARNGHADLQPIYISADTDVPNHATLLMLIDNRLDDDIARFDRCFYLFDGSNDKHVGAARAAWKQLKAQGLSLTYWQQSDNGKWDKKAS
jgi:DNA polymerase III subunit chi